MTFILSIVTFFILVIWNAEAYVKSYKKMPKIRDYMLVHVEKKDKSAFYFFSVLFIILFSSFVTQLSISGPASYFVSISLKDTFILLFFVTLCVDYLVRLSIYLNLKIDKVIQGRYLYELWNISAGDIAPGLKRIVLHTLNYITLLMFVLVFVSIII